MRDLIEDESLREIFGIPGLSEYIRAAASGASSGQGTLFADAGIPLHPVAEVPPELHGLSVNAYNAAVLAALNDLPPGAAIRSFCRKALSSADRTLGGRDDEDVRAVLEAAAKVTREIDRLRGFLRFRPDQAGIYIARCAPDHFVLPVLAGHFELRFGGTPWAVIDEKRRLALVCLPGEKTRLVRGAAPDAAQGTARDGWEELWRTYHRSVNNGARENPRLQRQFMPERYRKYLTEI
jgi:probable DNA metabolism protein